jgi:putative NADH-flavin reductase
MTAHRIVVFGAAGSVGRRVVAEALQRGHDVTAVVRRAEQLAELPEQVRGALGDATIADDVAALSAEQDVVIDATKPAPGADDRVIDDTRRLLNGVARSRARLIISGGAATLVVPGTGGKTVMEDPRYLPPWARPIAGASAAQLEACIDETRVDWAYVSPPARLEPGSRTGRYRLGSDELLVDGTGRSRISIEDLAVAILDEVEEPAHHQVRFTVAD